MSKLRETVKDREAWHAAFQGLQRVGHDLATKQQMKLKVLRPKNIYSIVFEMLDSVLKSRDITF